MTIYRNNRMVRGIFCCGGSLTGLLLGWTGTSALSAQTPAPAQPATQIASTPEATQSQRIFWKKTDIQLPIQINEKYRTLIREVQLYLKEQPTAPWTLRDKVGPDQKSFNFHAEREGEYAFTMVTVDKQGRCIPKDVQHEPPALVVVFDTKAPTIEWTNLGQSPEGQLIHFEAHDENTDNARVRFFFQSGDKQYRPLDMLPDRPNVYCVPVQAVFTGMVRATAEDLAGNRASSELHVSQLPKAKEAVAAQNPLALVPTPTHQDPVTAPKGTTPKLLPDNVKMDIPLLAQDLTPAQKPVEVVEPKVENPSTHTVYRRPGAAERPRFDVGEVKQAANTVESPVTPPVQPVTSRPAQTKRHLVNQSKIYLDYQVEHLGGGSVGKVEVWTTRDQGKTWTRHAEDLQGKSPAEVHLPEDGVYGVTLVVTSKQGTGGAAPVAGDAPDWLIEVDTTKPAAQITHIDTTRENGAALVQINWTATDKNLEESPVELSYSASPKGPWLVIARGLKSEGQFRWTPPASVGTQAFLRLSVRDQAGNTAVSGTMEAVHFETERPRAVIRSIRTEVSTSSVEKN